MTAVYQKHFALSAVFICIVKLLFSCEVGNPPNRGIFRGVVLSI